MRCHGLLCNTMIWGSLVVTVMVIGIPPYFHDQPCYIPSWVGDDLFSSSVSVRDVMFGRQYRRPVACLTFGDRIGIPLVIALLIGTLLTSGARLQLQRPFRTWTRIYVSAVTSQVLFVNVVQVWAFGWCPQKSFDASAFYAIGNGGQVTSYAVARMALFSAMIQCLKQVNAGGARQAGLLCTLLGGSYVGLFVWTVVTTASPDAAFPFWILYALGLYNVSMLLAISMQISLGLGLAARAAMEEAKLGDSDMDAALRVKRVAVASSFAAATTVARTIMKALVVSMHQVLAIKVLYEIMSLMDIGFDALMLLKGAEFLGVADLQEVGDLVEVGRQRLIEKKLRDIALASSGAEVAMAAMLGGRDARVLIDKAKARFRCISWDTLAQHPEIILNGQALSSIGPGHNNLYRHSTPCQLSDCDVFWSHAWDDDGDLKWAAIQSWCEAFTEERGRPPRLWLDKVCIDQSQIDEDLPCLPIFLGACRSLLITAGAKYPTRLWCALELFVFKAMGSSDGPCSFPIVLTLGNTRAEQDQVKLAWQNFDVAKLECSRESDKAKILRIMGMMPGGLQGFNAYMRMLSSELDSSTTARRLQEDEESV